MANIVQYRNKCIGCGICYELMPDLWRMSQKDGKATLVKSVLRRDVSVLQIPASIIDESKRVAEACPVRIIQVNE